MPIDWKANPDIKREVIAMRNDGKSTREIMYWLQATHGLVTTKDALIGMFHRHGVKSSVVVTRKPYASNGAITNAKLKRAPIVAPVTEGVVFIDSTRLQCKSILGGDPVMCCGKRVRVGSAWCQEHWEQYVVELRVNAR